MGINAIVGQSGGPTSAINATLAGVIRGAHAYGIDKLYGMKNGIEGLLNEDICDLSYLFGNEKELSLLDGTPSSILGSCRKRLPPSIDDETYVKAFSILEKYGIKYFFYIGGNDSMDTVAKLDKYAKENGKAISFVGIPKTIDNDLVLTDHTPGFGSAAKFIATTVQEIAGDCAVYKLNAVTIVEAMGRDAGWLTASSALAKHFTGQGADLVYLPEVPFSPDEFISSVKELLKEKPNIVVVVSEGARLADGRYVGESNQNGATDAFGHKYLAGAGKVLESMIRAKIGCKVRSVELNLPQRCAGHILSRTDITESVKIGKESVRMAIDGKNGIMSTFVREDGEYGIEISFVPVSEVANKVKSVPMEYINEKGNNVTEECIRYIAPLVCGEVQKRYENGLPVHFKLR
ncbi:MAG: 6-phosphofructokinase [Clostridia bacterium]|nr:6-phosphofructokinase [Clostridia bacterium]